MSGNSIFHTFLKCYENFQILYWSYYLESRGRKANMQIRCHLVNDIQSVDNFCTGCLQIAFFIHFSKYSKIIKLS